jgi:NodT family efflux transporter outer membrane factor (OMF) lipoprotein
VKIGEGVTAVDGRPALRMAGVSAALALLLCATVSCTKVGPDYHTPSVPQEASWLEEGDAKVDTTAPLEANWWEVFNDPILDKLITLAYAQNLTLQTAGLRVLEARARLGIAIGEQYPQTQEVGADLGYNRTSRNAANEASANQHFASADVGFGASWEIDFWGRFQRGMESADAQLGANVANYDDALVSLTSDVANTYVLMREAEELAAVAKNNIEIQRRSLDLTKSRFQDGVTTELDVFQAVSLLNSTEADLPLFEINRRQAENALAVLLGMTPDKLEALVGEPGKIPVAPTEVAIGIPAELLRRRPDIRQAELLAAAQSARIGIAVADLYPQFSLNGFIEFETSAGGGSESNNADFGDLFATNSLAAFIGPSIRLPIFNYGRLTNNVRVADARFQQTVTEYRNTVLEAYREVEDSVYAFTRYQTQAHFLGQSVEAQRKSVTLSLEQYREGVTNYQRVLDAQSSLFDLESQWVQSRGAISQNLIATYRALGGGWQTEKPRQFVPEETIEVMRARTDWGDLLPPKGLDPAPQSGTEAAETDFLFKRPYW